MSGIWELLGIPPTQDVRAIKRAYAARLKHCQPEDDPEGFRRLHEAYSLALHHAQAGQRVEQRMAPPPRGVEPPLAEIRVDTVPPRETGRSPRRRSPPPPVHPEARRAPHTQAPPPELLAPDPLHDARTLMEVLEREGEARALAEFQQLLEQSRYQSLLAKEELQKALLNGLPWTPPHPLAFLSALAERFGWHEGRHPYERAFPYQFQVIRQLRDEHQARLLLEDFAAFRKTRGYNLYQRLSFWRAARVMLGKTPRILYRLFSFDPWLKKSVVLLFKRVQQAYPLASQEIYDQVALRWCRVPLLASTAGFRQSGYVLLLLNTLTAMVTGFILTDQVRGRAIAAGYPGLTALLCQATAFLLLGFPLQILWANLSYWWLNSPRINATPAQHQASFWGAVALLYLLIALLPPLWGIYFWGLAVALFMVRLLNGTWLIMVVLFGGIVWSIFYAVLDGTPLGYTGPESHGWSRLNTPFLGGLFVMAVLQLHQRLVSRKQWWPSFRAFVGLLALCTLAATFVTALLLKVL